MEVPEGHPWAWPLQTARLAGAVGALELAASPRSVLVPWLSSLKMNWVANKRWWRCRRSRLQRALLALLMLPNSCLGHAPLQPRALGGRADRSRSTPGRDQLNRGKIQRGFGPAGLGRLLPQGGCCPGPPPSCLSSPDKSPHSGWD